MPPGLSLAWLLAAVSGFSFTVALVMPARQYAPFDSCSTIGTSFGSPFGGRFRHLCRRRCSPLFRKRVRQQQRQQRQHYTREQIRAGPIWALPGASLTVALGGCLAGGLHAISGPDHLAAVFPSCIGQRWWSSSRIGLVWAFGHGLTATILGFTAFLLKGRLTQGAAAAKVAAMLTVWAEAIVGMSLMLIGYLGIAEARQWEADDITHQATSPSSAEASLAPRRRRGNRAVIANGMLHGCSADGTLTLLPALALPSAGTALVFLLFYSLGTMLAMSAVTSLIGEASMRVSETLSAPNFPARLSMASSLLAVLVGVAWTSRAIWRMRSPLS
jgi:hypothetical protein